MSNLVKAVSLGITCLAMAAMVGCAVHRPQAKRKPDPNLEKTRRELEASNRRNYPAQYRVYLKDLPADAQAQVKAFTTEGMKYYNAGQYQEAIASFSKGIKIHEHNVDLLVWRGRSWGKLRVFGAAEDSFQSASRIDPKSTTPWLAKAEMYAAAGKDYHARAATAYMALNNLEPNVAEWWYWASVHCYWEAKLNRSGFFDNRADIVNWSINGFERALKLTHYTYADAYLAEAMVLLEFCDDAAGKAESYAKEALRYRPRDPEAYLIIAMANAQMGGEDRQAEALAAAQKALALDPENDRYKQAVATYKNPRVSRNNSDVWGAVAGLILLAAMAEPDRNPEAAQRYDNMVDQLRRESEQRHEQFMLDAETLLYP